jgi:choline-sulfatase
LRTVPHLLTCLALLLPLPLIAATPSARKAKPNVILITIDTVRADHVGCYGATGVRTPTLDGLARDGIVFERAFSQVPLTWPSHAAILTGTYPFQNGVQDFTGQPLDPKFRSVAEAFKRSGYATGAVVSAFVLDRGWGLARGFDFYDDAFSAETFQQKDIGLVDRKAGESVTHALDWLKKTPRKPFFLWLHMYDPHSPYDPPEPYRTQYRSHPYDGEIAYADHELGRLISWLNVLLSDHGESLGDHGEKEHGFFVYNATVHVPLIVKPPAGSGFQPSRIPRPVETIDVAPTLLRSAGVKDVIDKQFQSPGLLASATENDQAAYSETFYPFSSFGWSPLHALETSRYHYIDAPIPELYDVMADPEEKSNLASQQTAIVAVLKDKLQVRLRNNPFKPDVDRTSQLSPDAIEKLRALGYVAYHSPVSAEALAAGLPDPKTRLWEFNSILEAGDAFQAHNFQAGQDLLEKVREKDPQMYVVPFMLGEAEARRENWAAAAAELKKCLELNPNFDQAMTGLARALYYLGDAAGAKSWVEKALKYNPQNYRAWYQMGIIQSKTDKVAAASAYEKALSIQPNFALGQRGLGMLQFQQQNYTDAAKHLARSVDLGLTDAKLFNFLGISYSRTNRQQKAIESYREALQLDPKLAEAHLNLGFAYEGLHKPSLARKEYQEACRLREEFCQLVKDRKPID